jgi:hypothetical protein
MWPEPEPKKSRIELLKELVFGWVIGSLKR